MCSAHDESTSAELVYDKIGIGYTSRRRSDPTIFSHIEKALSCCTTVLNVGAGTGSYEPTNCTLAVKPSQEMIKQRPRTAAHCIRAAAERLPLGDKSFDGTLASLTIHHWKDIQAGLAEMRRVTRKRIVLFTWDPEFESDFWLTRDYLPVIVQQDRPRFPTVPQLGAVLQDFEVQTVLIPAQCQDGFPGSFWKRPEAYLDSEVQRTNSAMAQLDPEHLRDGLRRLERDLASGIWADRNSHLARLTELDLGYRLVLCDLT